MVSVRFLAQLNHLCLGRRCHVILLWSEAIVLLSCSLVTDLLVTQDMHFWIGILSERERKCVCVREIQGFV